MSLPSAPRSFAAVLLDVDGTLIDTIPMIVEGLRDSYSRFADQEFSDAELKGLIGLPLAVQMNRFGLQHRTEESLEDRVRFTMERYVAHADKIVRFPEMERAWALLEDQQVPLALVTSRNREELEWISQVFPFLQRVQAKISSSDVINPKPAADPVLAACLALDVKPHDVVFIGDSVHDVESAHAAGSRSAACAFGASPLEALQSTRPDFLFETPADCLAWLQTLDFQLNLCSSANRIPT